MPVLVDSGFRRGIDIIKALALDARGLRIRRPYLWGLAVFGQPGVAPPCSRSAHSNKGSYLGIGAAGVRLKEPSAAWYDCAACVGTE